MIPFHLWIGQLAHVVSFELSMNSVGWLGLRWVKFFRPIFLCCHFPADGFGFPPLSYIHLSDPP